MGWNRRKKHNFMWVIDIRRREIMDVNTPLIKRIATRKKLPSNVKLWAPVYMRKNGSLSTSPHQNKYLGLKLSLHSIGDARIKIKSMNERLQQHPSWVGRVFHIPGVD